MGDIVERLREAYDLVKEWPEKRPDGFIDLLALRNLTPEAADEIARLRAENEALREALRRIEHECTIRRPATAVQTVSDVRAIARAAYEGRGEPTPEASR